jgi:hypothetical protein
MDTECGDELVQLIRHWHHGVLTARCAPARDRLWHAPKASHRR